MNIWFAFGMSVIAGLSTGIGSLIAFLAKTTNKRFLGGSLGFSAGVMIYISMIEIFSGAQDTLIAAMGPKPGAIATVASFFGGMAIIALIDKFIPHENNHHALTKQAPPEENGSHAQLMRTGLFTAIAIAVHNFPEGLATFVSALQNPTMAIPIVVAIAIHNIPEGIAVSVPIYYATGSRAKAFFYSFFSGLAEPVGAIVGYLLLLPIMNDIVFGVLFAAVAGIMVFISLEELLPSAREYGGHKLSVYGVVAGMAVMAVSLVLFL